MKGLLTQVRSYERSVQLLMVNQFTINVGFYMLMPYLAAHLSGTLGLAGWIVGLVLGVRNFSQQGMFLVGGTLADRIGYKPMIVAGCVLRTLAFATLGLVDSLPALLAASAATGLAGALFNPAVRAYLATDAGERRVEAFALFNVFYQAGILLGPLVGMVLTGVDFRITCLVAAGIFALLSVVQIRALPTRRAEEAKREDGDGGRGVLAQWRGILANRPFLLFSVAMIGSYVLSFQVYLALPLEVRRLGGDGEFGTAAVAVLFAVSGLSTILGQTRVTAWCKARYEPGQALVRGLAVMGLAFVPLLLATAVPVPESGIVLWLLAAVPPTLAALLLAIGTMIAYPFEMDTIVRLSGDRLVATHYGLYNTVCGVGITVGNLGTGAALDAARAAGMPALPWITLFALGLVCAAALYGLHRTGRLAAPPVSEPLPATV
ncbi:MULTISPECIES: MFS transporter [Streptomyces]|uniref:MFS transporter n=1 Tax=Streptomyces plicatus TaxID=1922 RepID=A0ABW1Y4K8_STRPL|nr:MULTISPECIES: MFS transporter [Streptomyces]RIH60493.1 MFS transporter [Streptomyces sp. SHP22-7]MBJ6622267.1 MFS transporter [Streptomyces sp. DHE17-7]RSS66316.1 MFS transporter [Streptomyces sp. WAC06273]GGZ73326.1 putative ABC transporter, permease protein [Streptomyces plicatus]GHC27645.1 putative ABC transporter, permease protein [Streptomyces vinaceusdrappus]